MGAKQTDVPSHHLMLEMFNHTPSMLLLDEFQTWFDGLRNTKQEPSQTLGVQLRSDPRRDCQRAPGPTGARGVSTQRPRRTPTSRSAESTPSTWISTGAGVRRRSNSDRRRMLLHRLFENRLQIAASERGQTRISTHVTEYFRLADTPGAEQERKKREFAEAWPFAPHLLQLLEDQVLIATDAQETRDLIRILANLFRSRSDDPPLLTAADFRLEDDSIRDRGFVGLSRQRAAPHAARQGR